MPDLPDERLALPVEQAALLWCMRVWLLGLRHPVEGSAGVQDMMDRLGAPEAAPLLQGFMSALGDGAVCAIDLRCVCCRNISHDERSLLDVLALAQGARPFEALLLLRCFVTPEAARIALHIAEGIGATLAEAGRLLMPPEAEMRHFAFTPTPALAAVAGNGTLH